MCDEKIAIRVLLRHYWKKGLSAKATAEQICDVDCEGTVHRNTTAVWFKRFTNGDTSLEDNPRSGQPNDVDDKALLAALEEKPHSSARELSNTLLFPNL